MRKRLDPRSVLAGGDPRSLGRAQEVVDAVLADPDQLPELFDAVLDEDELVRMRAADAVEKVASRHPEWLVPYVERLLSEVAGIEQDSVRWHVAQLLGEVPLSAEQRERAIALLERFADEGRNGFVVAHSLSSLAALAEQEQSLRPALRRRLERLAKDERSSVAKRAGKLLALED